MRVPSLTSRQQKYARGPMCSAARMTCGCVITCLLAAWAHGQGTAVPRALRLDHTIKGDLSRGQTESFTVHLEAGDYLQCVIDQIAGHTDATVYGPAGDKVKFISNDPVSSGRPLVEQAELELVDVIALSPGEYRIETRPAGEAPVRYTITYSEHKTMAERTRLGPVFRPLHSVKIDALRRELQGGNASALAAFWTEIDRTGSPLIEPIAADPQHCLVTVLWRDKTGLKNVALRWESYANSDPEQYAFEHLAQSDVWYLTLRLPRGARFVYQLSADDDLVPYSRFDIADNNAAVRHDASAMLDPLNPKKWIQHNGEFSLAELPGAPPQPWVEKRPGIAEGRIEKRQFKNDRLGNEREIAIYTPPGYSAHHSPYPLMVLFDEKQYLTMVPTPTILDNLIAAQKIPPLVAVLVDAVDRDTRRTETMGANADAYADVMSTDLIAWILASYNVTRDPAQTIAAGSSANGFASMYMAWRHPDVFGNVLCQSGALFWEPGTGPGTGVPLGEHPEWLARQVAQSPKKAIRFFVEAGLFEDSREGILDTSRHFRDVALARGYEIHYQEFAGGHNYINWRGSLADGLIYLASPWPSNSKRGKP